MFQTTALLGFQKGILVFSAYLISLLCSDWLRKQEHLPEFFMLMLSALLGMFLMISSGNLLMFYLSLELSTIPVAALANFDLQKKISSEASMKMILSSAFSSGILLFGISLIYGATGTLSFSEMPDLLNGSPLQILAFILLVTGFAFKLSVVPFHLWTADVYQGSPVAVAAFLSVVSKGAIAFVFISTLYKVFYPMDLAWHRLLVILSLLTIVFGNLFAIRQQNIKRFLAFSSIAQVGFILVGILGASKEGLNAVIYFVLIYAFSNLGAFGVAAVISAASGKENIDEYKNLYENNKLLSWVMALSLFSLAGIPPLAGFFGKFFLIMAGASQSKIWFIIVVAINLMVSLYYYLRVVRAIFMDKNEQPVEKIPVSYTVKLGLFICSAGIILTGLMSWIYEYINSL
jgi:NADH-quinone oxidoreductase subunit N